MDLMSEETGRWYYLVVDTHGIRPRSGPSYQSAKMKHGHFTEGTVVEIDRRASYGLTRWLRLDSSGGWVFDVSPKNNKVRMVEVEVLTGEWRYQALLGDIMVMPRPSVLSGYTPHCGGRPPLGDAEIVTVNRRIRPLNSKGSFLELADGGYVLDYYNGRHLLKRQYCAVMEEQADRIMACDEKPRLNVNSSPALMTSGLVAASAEATEDVDEGERGSWTYVVIDPKGICMRSKPTYNKSCKVSAKLEEGDLVQVDERRLGENTTFLHITSPQGWAFDTQPGIGTKRRRMSEVQKEEGQWFYRVIASNGVTMRSRCSMSESCKVGKVRQQGSFLEIVERVIIGRMTFGRLKDATEWAHDSGNTQRAIEGPLDVEKKESTWASVRIPGGIHLLTDPIDKSWAVTKMYLLQSAKVQVSLIWMGRWAFVSKPGGMEGWLPTESLEVDANEAQPRGVDRRPLEPMALSRMSSLESTKTQPRHSQARDNE